MDIWSIPPDEQAKPFPPWEQDVTAAPRDSVLIGALQAIKSHAGRAREMSLETALVLLDDIWDMADDALDTVF